MTSGSAAKAYVDPTKRERKFLDPQSNFTPDISEIWSNMSETYLINRRAALSNTSDQI